MKLTNRLMNMSIETTSYTPVARYLLEIAYDGTEYSGWQIQPHCVAVQQVMQERLTKLYDRQPIHLIGCSRTDAGVHAQGFAASFLVPERPVIPPERLYKALNRQLPPAIRIRDAGIVVQTKQRRSILVHHPLQILRIGRNAA